MCLVIKKEPLMKTIADHMSFYEAYHRHPLNKLTHFVGIPAIVFSILVPLGWISVELGGVTLTGAMVLVGVALGYYLLLQPAFALGMALFILPTLYAAHQVSRMGWLTGLAVFLLFFVGGWIFQIVGHVVFEKRRPALVDNLFQMVIGPVFLVAEVFFLLGYRPGLHAEVRELSMRHLPKNAGK